MIKKFSTLTMPVNPFARRIRKTCEARTLLLGIVTFATLLFSGCANGGLGAKTGASFISPSEQRQDRFGTAWAAENGGFVDFSKDPNNQPGPTYPRYGSIGEP
jgi:hypothetical protein